MRASIALTLACSLASLVLLTSCSAKLQSEEGSDPKKSEEEQRVPVEVAALRRGEIEATWKTSAYLEAEEEVRVFPRASNRIVELMAEEGDKVVAGQILARLEDHMQRTQLAKAEAQVTKARQEFERQKTLFEQKLISEQVFNDSQFELKQLELALEDAQREFEYTQIRTPIKGTVTRRLANIGVLVKANDPNPNQNSLFEVVNFESMVARVWVPEKNLKTLSLNQRARVTAVALKGMEFEGYVKRISPIVESKTGLVKVTIAFKEIGPLRPGMYVDVEIILAKHTDALLIAKRAIVPDADQQLYVFRLLPDRRVERVLLEPKLEDDLNIEPLRGFNEGDQIVIAGQSGLKDGSKVRLPGDPKPEEKSPPNPRG